MKFSLGKPEPLFIADDFYDENRRSCRLFLCNRKLLRNVPITQKRSARMRLCRNTESLCFQRQKKNNFAGSAGD